MNFRNGIISLLLLVVIINSCSKKGGTNPPPSPSIPGCASNTSPSNEAFVAAGSSLTLSWTTVSGATSYDIYLGATSSPSTIIASNVTGTTYNYLVPVFASSQTLYWYVQPKNASGGPAGCSASVTSFISSTIIAPPPFGYYVVGYFPSYRNPADVPDVKFRMTNVVVYAFFTVNTSGTLDVVLLVSLSGRL